MRNNQKDKVIEYNRYELRAQNIIGDGNLNLINVGSKSKKNFLQSPYIKYEEIIRNLSLTSKHKVLEMACGMGEFSNLLVESDSNIVFSDISETSLKALELRYSHIKKIKFQVADMERLPFLNSTFDYIFMAGGLSYGDNYLVLNEIHRVLKPNGKFISVDSLNHNPIYKFNRWVNVLLGKRSKSTLKRMPTLFLIENYIKTFGEGKVYFFGGFSWIFNILSYLLNFNVNKISDWLDSLFCVKKSSFKFVLIVKKNE